MPTIVTDEQLRLRDLVERLRREEMPLDSHDLIRLQHFVQVTREEIKEDETPGKRRVYRVTYYTLNERGLKLLQKWHWGMLDRYLPEDKPQ